MSEDGDNDDDDENGDDDGDDDDDPPLLQPHPRHRCHIMIEIVFEICLNCL